MTDEDGLDVPNCPLDLTAMVPVGEDEHARWRCPECGLVMIA